MHLVSHTSIQTPVRIHAALYYCYLSSLNNHHGFPKLTRDTNVKVVSLGRYQWCDITAKLSSDKYGLPVSILKYTSL